MRFFSTSPSLGLWAAGLVAVSGCSLIAAPDESLLEQSGSTSTGSTSSTSSTTSTTTTSSTGGDGGEGGGTVTTSSQGGGGSDQGGGGANQGGGGANQGGAGGQGGQGGGPDCVDPAVDCADPVGECTEAFCNAGVCDIRAVDQGTVLTLGQNPGDCQVIVCNGDGGTEQIDDNDDNGDDPLDCVVSVCIDGTLDETELVDDGEECAGLGSGLECLGGLCIGCVAPSDCGADEPCQTRTCVDNVCGLAFIDDGVVVDDGVDENCQQVTCNGLGSGVPTNDDGDVEDDGIDCTTDSCEDGSAVHDIRGGGSVCNDLNGGNGAGFCDGSGAEDSCVACFIDDNCGPNNLCETNNCNAGNTCDGRVFTPPNQEVADPTDGDCSHTVCDGSGTVVPNDPEDAGTACNVSGGTTCDATGNCITGFCDDNTDCDGLDTACTDVSCNLGTNQCTTVVNINEGGIVPPDSATDCVQNTCVGGVSTPGFDNTEIPPADGNTCTNDVCSSGTPYTPVGVHNACIGGGGFCTAANVCVECTQDGPQCPSGSCDEGTNLCDAVLPTCFDVIENQDETDVDCGGVCGATCDDGEDCILDSDCANDFCRLDTDECATPTCSDTFTNQDETDVDCGGICGATCALGDTCADDGDCASGECTAGLTCGLAAPITLLTENFDALPQSGPSTLPIFEAALASGAWQLNSGAAATQAGTGSSNGGAIWSFGLTPVGDRALGGVGSGGTGSQGWGVCLANPTAATLSTITVAYNGEQWRDGGAATPAAQPLAFSISTFITAATLEAEVRTAPTGDRTTGWENIAALSFTSPIFVSTSGTALDGNDAANRTAISGSIPGLTLAPAATVCIRWFDINDAGNDHGLAIDDLVITGL